MAILSRPYRGREACARCGFCWGFGCEWGAKSSTLAAMIPSAVATGRCEVRPKSYVRRIDTDARGRVTGVTYFDSRKREVMQRAKAVVLCANGAESPRLLLMSESSRFTQGLANSSGLVGKNIMPNGGSVAGGLFEHEVNGFLGPPVTRIVLEHYELEPSLGIAGGAGIDFRFAGPGPLIYAMYGLPEDAPKWGSARKEMLREYYSRSMMALTHTTSLPQENNSISLDPELKDAWGLPAIRTTYREHPNDVKLIKFIQDRAVDLIDAAGAKRSWRLSVSDDPGGLYHLLGTCRMGNDPAKSVVDRYHRAHDVRNLFIVDGSSFVTSGRGQPTMTIQALAFRAAEHIAAAAKRREI
jgi:choline dehydrogenase-like flavoprotein